METLPLRAETPTFPTDWLLPILIACPMPSSTYALVTFSCSSLLRAFIRLSPSVPIQLPGLISCCDRILLPSAPECRRATPAPNNENRQDDSAPAIPHTRPRRRK